MNTRQILPASFVLASVALAACGADQDPALDVPDDVSATTTSAAAPGGPTSAEASFGPIELSGAAEIPGPGDEDGSGVANVYLEEDGSICYDFIGIDGIDTPTAAHIHEGGESVAGPVVLPLETPTEGSLDACVADQAELSARIAENPAGFYVNVHNADFPDGAIRGQLQS